MVLKRRNKISEEANALADELADKTYGELPADQPIAPESGDRYVITSISIQQSLLHQLEDLAIRNKRADIEPKTVSALVRAAVHGLLINS